MEPDFPVRERIYVLKGDESLGPFWIDELLEKLEAGELRYDDVCLREGAGETERLRQILDWEEFQPEKVAVPGRQKQPEPNETATAEPVSSTEESESRPAPVLYHGHRSIVSYPLSFLTLVGGFIGAIWLYPAGLPFVIMSLSFSAFALAYLTVMRYTREYFITGKRVELVTGLIARSSKEVRIVDIRAVNITCKGIPGMLGIGHVDFFTIGDNPEVTFAHAWAAKDIKSLVRKLQDSKSQS